MMYNRRFVVSKDDLNSGNIVLLNDIPFELIVQEIKGRNVPRIFLPREYQIINDTGDMVEINFFKDPEEYYDSTQHPELYAFIRIPNETMAQDTYPVGSIKLMTVKGTVGGTATKDLVIEMLRYSAG